MDWNQRLTLKMEWEGMERNGRDWNSPWNGLQRIEKVLGTVWNRLEQIRMVLDELRGDGLDANLLRGARFEIQL